jgi:gluconolactonase
MSHPEIEIIADDLQFPEGPVVCDDGSILVVEIRRRQITRIRKDGRKQAVASVEGGPNGAAFGPDGALWVCNNGGFAWARRPGTDNIIPAGTPPDYQHGWIERIDTATGKAERVYEGCDGVPLSAPNDIVFDSSGGFWFTDQSRDMGRYALHGGLYYARADGGSIRRMVYALGLNGVGLSPDGATVYAAETQRRVILAFPAVRESDATAQGAIPAVLGHGPSTGRLVASFPGRQLLDSLAIEGDGTIAQATVGEAPGIARVDPPSGRVTLAPMPDRLPTNIAFGGQDLRDAYVTLSESGRLARIRWPAPGLRLAFGGA